MPASKPVVFVSHITEEALIARELKGLLERSFLGAVDLFVSSDLDSNPRGSNWLDNVTDAMRACHMMFLVCSPKSIERPWLNFEAGAAWVKRLPAIPVCHSGMTPSALPLPMKLLGGVVASDYEDMRTILSPVAKLLDMSVPDVDFGPFATMVIEFEEQYTFWTQFNTAFGALRQILGPATMEQLLARLRNGTQVDLQMVASRDVERIRTAVRFLEERSVLRFHGPLTTLQTPDGVFHTCRMEPAGTMIPLLADRRFRPSATSSA